MVFLYHDTKAANKLSHRDTTEGVRSSVSVPKLDSTGLSNQLLKREERIKDSINL